MQGHVVALSPGMCDVLLAQDTDVYNIDNCTSLEGAAGVLQCLQGLLGSLVVLPGLVTRDQGRQHGGQSWWCAHSCYRG